MAVLAPSLVSDPKANYIGTEPWKPKEALEEEEITDKADIFAFGLTLWEMMTLAMPHLEMIDFNDDEEGETGNKKKKKMVKGPVMWAEFLVFNSDASRLWLPVTWVVQNFGRRI